MRRIEIFAELLVVNLVIGVGAGMMRASGWVYWLGAMLAGGGVLAAYNYGKSVQRREDRP